MAKYRFSVCKKKKKKNGETKTEQNRKTEKNKKRKKKSDFFLLFYDIFFSKVFFFRMLKIFVSPKKTYSSARVVLPVRYLTIGLRTPPRPSLSESKCIWCPLECGRRCAHHSANLASFIPGKLRSANTLTCCITWKGGEAGG